MSDVVVGCDINDGNDAKVLNTVCSALERAGHNVEKLSIGPNNFASYSYSSSKSAGKFGVFLHAAGTYSIADYYYGAAKNNNSFKFAVFAIRGDIKSQIAGREPGFSTRPIGADADCPASLCANIRGLTFKQMNEKLKDKLKIVGGASAEEIAKNVVNAIGGGSDSNDGESSASTIKDAIKEVASFWDGEVEITVDHDTVRVRKIPSPEEKHLENSIIEGVNVELGSISIQDYHPDTINTLKVHWPGGDDIIFTDDTLISRFGEKLREADAVKRIVKEKEETSTTTTTTTDTASDTTDTSTTTDTDTVEVEETSTTSNTTYEEVPCETYDEALSFANLEWGKIRRNNGHEIELKAIGDYNYKPAWVHVKLYSYPTDMWMYIRASNHEISENGEFYTNITLVDYPPSLGEWNETESDEEENTEDETTDEGADV